MSMRSVRGPSRRVARTTALVLTLIGIGAAPALAQPLPGPAEIQRVPGRFDTPLSPLVQPEAPAIVVPPAEAPGPDLEAVRFLLRELRVDGNTVLDDAALAPLWEDKLNTEISIVELYRIANAITAAYRDAGYIISRAIVPAQRIAADGSVRIQVVEGFVSKVIIEGMEDGLQGRIGRLLRRIEKERPLNVAALERYLLLADDLGGVELTSVIRAATDQLGAAELVVSVARDRAEGYLLTDNRGSKLLGPFQTELGGSLYNPFDYDATLSARMIVASPVREMRYGEISYRQPLGSDGTALTLSLLRAETEPSDALRPLEIEGTTEEGSILLEHLAIRSRLENLRLHATLTVRAAETTALGSAIISEDDLRVLAVGVTYDWFDAMRGINLIDATLSQGLKVFGASDSDDLNLSRAGGRSDFTKLKVEASRLQGIGDGFEAYAVVAGQLTSDPLLSSEEFGLGGDRFGRGFDPSEVVGDKGVGLAAEIRYTPDIDLDYLNRVQGYAFYDIGAVWDNDASAVGRRSLASAGLGARIDLLERMSGFVELAKPLTRDVASRGDRDLRVLGGLSVRF